MIKKLNESIISAGFGGQGVLTVGKFFAGCAMEEGYYVTWLPSYGAEVRGGTAHAFVRISSDPIPNPKVTLAKTAVIMNDLSLNMFEDRVEIGGLMILNSSMMEHEPKRQDIKIIPAPLTEEAIKLGNIKVANMIAAGIYSAIKKIFDKENIVKVIHKMPKLKKDLKELNVKAVERGMELAERFFSNNQSNVAKVAVNSLTPRTLAG